MLLVVDLSNLIYAHYHISASRASVTVASQIKDMVDRFKPTDVAVVFDGRDSWRKLVSKEYKADRPQPPDDLIAEIAKCWVVLSVVGIKCLKVDQYEADDVICTIAKGHGGKVIIASTDTDLHCCLDPGRVVILKRFRSPAPGHDRVAEWFTADTIMDKYGVTPDKWREYQCLIGKTGQWRGAFGIGEKTATELFKMFGSLAAIIEYAHGSDCEHLTEKKKLAIVELSSRLPFVSLVATLRDDLEIEYIPIHNTGHHARDEYSESADNERDDKSISNCATGL